MFPLSEFLSLPLSLCISTCSRISKPHVQLEYVSETFKWIFSTSKKTRDEQNCPYATASEASLAEEINELDKEGWGAGEEVPRGARTMSSLDVADENSPVKRAALDELRKETESGEPEIREDVLGGRSSAGNGTEQKVEAAAAAAAEGLGIVQTIEKPTETSEVVVEIS